MLATNLMAMYGNRMIRTQVQLPDELYRRAKEFSAEREISLVQMTRRALEQFLDRDPKRREDPKTWKFPVLNSGGVKLTLDEVDNLLFEEESSRGLARDASDDR